jgi:hypothetical protein
MQAESRTALTADPTQLACFLVKGIGPAGSELPLKTSVRNLGSQASLPNSGLLFGWGTEVDAVFLKKSGSHWIWDHSPRSFPPDSRSRTTPDRRTAGRPLSTSQPTFSLPAPPGRLRLHVWASRTCAGNSCPRVPPGARGKSSSWGPKNKIVQTVQMFASKRKPAPKCLAVVVGGNRLSTVAVDLALFF